LSKAAAAVERLACVIDRAQRGAVEIRVGWFDIEDTRLKQRLFGRARDLLIDEIGDPRSLCPSQASVPVPGTSKQSYNSVVSRHRFVRNP
jgi:hypothetical protein